MSEKLKPYLQVALGQLRKRQEQAPKGQGFNLETAKLKMLEEIIKEQMPHENPGHSTGKTR